MILVPHYVAQSAIAGAGLFAGADIEKDEIVYRFDYRFVMVICDSEIQAMPEAMRAAVLKYSYRGKGRDRLAGAVYFCADDSRFMNHSATPNTRWLEHSDIYIATRRIPKDTEISCDYSEFCEPGDELLTLVG